MGELCSTLRVKSIRLIPKGWRLYVNRRHWKRQVFRPKTSTEIDFSRVNGINMFQKEQVNKREKVYTEHGEREPEERI